MLATISLILLCVGVFSAVAYFRDSPKSYAFPKRGALLIKQAETTYRLSEACHGYGDFRPLYHLVDMKLLRKIRGNRRPDLASAKVELYSQEIVTCDGTKARVKHRANVDVTLQDGTVLKPYFRQFRDYEWRDGKWILTNIEEMKDE